MIIMSRTFGHKQSVPFVSSYIRRSMYSSEVNSYKHNVEASHRHTQPNLMSLKTSCLYYPVITTIQTRFRLHTISEQKCVYEYWSIESHKKNILYFCNMKHLLSCHILNHISHA